MQLTQLLLSGAFTISIAAAISSPVIDSNMDTRWGPPGTERPHIRVIKEPSRHSLVNPHDYTGIAKKYDGYHVPPIVPRGDMAEKKLKNVPLVNGDPPWVGNYLRPATETEPKWAEKAESGFPRHEKEPKIEKIHAREKEHLRKLAERHRESHAYYTRDAEANPYADAEADAYADPESYAEAEAMEIEEYPLGWSDNL
ncbi:hypothetical protein MMC34_002699 [Xylographa carneopallida]|nr:hypothetical protein [Xylographa carneopallida]